MDPLARYYLRQAGRGNTNGIGPIYEAPPVLQRGYGIGSFLTGLWRTVRPILWCGAKTLGRETLGRGGDILSDMARWTGGESPRDILSRRVNETVQNSNGKLRGRGRKRKAKAVKRKKITAPRKRRLQKEISSPNGHHSLFDRCSSRRPSPLWPYL